MIPLRELKVKSAVRVENRGDSIQAADPQNSTMKRDVQTMRDEMKSGIIKIEDTFKPIEHHVYTVLKNSTIGHLHFNIFGIQILFKKSSSFS